LGKRLILAPMFTLTAGGVHSLAQKAVTRVDQSIPSPRTVSIDLWKGQPGGAVAIWLKVVPNGLARKPQILEPIAEFSFGKELTKDV
jgi:hypothetical protein